MLGGRRGQVLCRFGLLLRAWAADDNGDGPLLERFACARDEMAFTALVQRHGAMVLGVCRRVLGHEHDSEDVFQATFLLLARKAPSIRNKASVASWLHGVAYRLALRARTGAARRRAHEQRAARPDRAGEALGDDLRTVLDEELGRLPEKYRLPVVLCDLQGQTHEEASRLIGCAPGSMSWRLDRGRELLRQRLTRRGFTLSAGLLGTMLAEQAALAAVPPCLLATTVRAAVAFAAGEVAGGIVSAPAAALVKGMLKTMFLAKLRIGLVVLLVLGALGAGASLVLRPETVAKPPEREKEELIAAKAPAPLPRGPRMDRHGDALPDGALARMGTLRLRHGGRVRSVAVSPDGKLFASSAADRTVRIWQAATGKELHRFQGPPYSGASVAFSPDSRSLAFPGEDGTLVLVRDTTTGKERARLKHEKGVYCATFSLDGKILATGSESPEIRLWDVATGKELRRFGGDARQAAWVALTFVPDGKTLAAVPRGGGYYQWDLSTGKEFLPHGDPGAPMRTPYLSGASYPIAFAPKGSALMGVNSYGIDVYELPTWANRYFIWAPKGGHVMRAAVFSPDGKQIVGGASDGVVRLWDAATGKEIRRFEGNQGDLLGVAFAPDGKTVVSAGEDRTVRAWDVATGKERLPFSGHLGPMLCVALSPNGKVLATAGRDRTVRLWERLSGKELRVLRGHRSAVRSVAFSPGGKTLASASGDKTVRLWNVASGKEERCLEGHQYYTSGVAFSPDGKTLAAVGVEVVRRYKDYVGEVVGVSFAPDGTIIVSAGKDWTVRWPPARNDCPVPANAATVRGASPWLSHRTARRWRAAERIGRFT